MKAPAFTYHCPCTVDEAIAHLGSDAGAKAIAGGQTLSPMLNLRLARPSALVDLTRLPELKTFEETAALISYGACLTHANFEDGLVPDAASGFLAMVAHGIAYRAIRTRGTLGGSLVHADPAADWLSALLALDASVKLYGKGGSRILPLSAFVRGALFADIQPDEILMSVIVPKPSAADRFGYAKICRKTGEFAEAIGVVRRFGDGRKVRLVSGGGDTPPVVIENGEDYIHGRSIDRERLFALGFSMDPYGNTVRTAALERALDGSYA